MAGLALNFAGCSPAQKSVKVYKTGKQVFGLPEGSSQTSPAGDFSWDSPPGWVPQPPSSMRVASFLVPSQEESSPQQDGDVSIVVLGGVAGGLLANVNRWREQVGLSPTTGAQLKAQAQKVESGLGSVTWFKIENTKESPQGILAGVLELQAKTIFIKFVASPNMLKQQQRHFLALCQSLRKTL